MNMKRWISRMAVLIALFFASTLLTGCFFTAKMFERPKFSEEEYPSEQTEDVTKEEETEGAKEREDTKEQAGTRERRADAQQGSVSQSTAPDTDGTKESEAVSAAQEERIRHIAEVYDRTIQDQGNYRQEGGRYYTAGGVLAKAVVSNGDPVLDEVMRKSGYKTYALEYFYEDWPQGDGYPIYIYAVIDENVYRYYFCQGEFIRRIGPEGGGNTNDAPKMNAFIQTLRDEGAAYRGQTGDGQESGA